MITTSKMTIIAPSTARVRKLRERRFDGVAMVAPVEVGEGGIDLLVSNGLLNRGRLRAITGTHDLSPPYLSGSAERLGAPGFGPGLFGLSAVNGDSIYFWLS